MVLWFSVLALSGLVEVVQHPGILRALSPSYGIEFFLNHGSIAFLALGSVVLAVTGAEALYADMGHFGRPPIWAGMVPVRIPRAHPQLPGTGLADTRPPEAIDNPFFLLLSIVEGNAKNRPDSRAVCSLSGHRLCLARAGLKVDGGGPHRLPGVEGGPKREKGSGISFKPGVCPIRQKSAFLPVHPDNRRISPHIDVRRRESKAGAKPLVLRDSGSAPLEGSLIVVAAVAGSNPVSHPF
jgi:hypothetical protein